MEPRSDKGEVDRRRRRIVRGRRNGYGNLIVLRHHGGYSTYYAHLRNFAPALRAGSRVVQGEIIGHVGQTGWANGPTFITNSTSTTRTAIR